MILGVIPARYGSTRFPGKPLALIHGKPMIQRVYEQSVRCELLQRVVIATDDERIAEVVEKFRGEYVMTSNEHSSGTSRCAEAVKKLAGNFSVVINIQGDEPFIDSEEIALLCGCFKKDSTEIATLIKKITSNEEIFNPNVVKVAKGEEGQSLYFSRSPIPHLRDVPEQDWVSSGQFYKHLGIYGYRVPILEKIVKLPLDELESAESLEQLRWLANGFNIQTVVTKHDTVAIDTPEDIIRAEKLFPENN